MGRGNFAAQILAELSQVTETTWVTLRPPRLLPDELDGRALFCSRHPPPRAALAGQDDPGIGELGDIVAVAPVREARDRGVLKAETMVSHITFDGVAWADGSTAPCDVILWCTGFRPALGHLAPLRLRGANGRIPTDGTRALIEPRLHLLGYGDWTGLASATLIGAGRTARQLAAELAVQLWSCLRFGSW
ncbi:hypothetical protein WBK31_12605 [Nonomuraea sp. N2-4H]|uniref:hypothetical protein n=1 Tax=Nonomuraea sp. N2-4H TaxID=3128898 RepID=UPI00324974CE